MDQTALDRVPLLVRDSVQQFAGRVTTYGGAHVLGLMLYGPVAGPTFDANIHMIHSVLMLDAMGLEILRRLSGEGSRFGRRRFTAPMVMTPAFLQASRDSFPLELIEMQQQRLVLLGEDFFAGVTFDPPHVRLQCERELKSLSVGMRQAVVADGVKEASIQRAALPAIFGLVRVMRGMLWLKGRTEALPATTILAEIENLAGRHLPGVRRAFDFPSAVDWIVFQQLYDDIEALGTIADGW